MSHLDFHEQKTSTPFDGDIYADDDPVTRGVALSSAPVSSAWGKEYADWSLDAEPKLFVNAQPISLPVEDLPRHALATVASASSTALAEAVLAFFHGSGCDALVQVDKTTGAMDVDLRVAYELLRLSLRFCAVRAAAQPEGRVAAVWQREAGDGVEFLRTVRECTEFLAAQGLGAKLVHGSPSGARAGGLLAAPFDVTPPVSPNGSLSRHLGEECATAEDMMPLLSLAEDPDPRARCEALAAMCRIFDDELDAATLAEVLAPETDVVLGWVADPALELCAPALARKLAAHDTLPASSLVPALMRALEAREGSSGAGTQLGTRQLAWALAQVASSGVEPEPSWGDLTAQMVTAHSDDATRRYLLEAQIALRA